MGKSIYLIGNLKPTLEKIAQFREAQAVFSKEYDVINPLDHIIAGSEKDRLQKQLKMMIDCSSAVLLDGWIDDNNARFLFYIAKELGIHVISLNG